MHIVVLQRFRRLIKKGDYITAMAVARKQVEEGAMILDLNVDDGMIDGVKAMGMLSSAKAQISFFHAFVLTVVCSLCDASTLCLF